MAQESTEPRRFGREGSWLLALGSWLLALGSWLLKLIPLEFQFKKKDCLIQTVSLIYSCLI